MTPSDSRTRLFLITPRLHAASDLPALDATLRAADVACLLLRLAPMGERDSKDVIKALAPSIQQKGVALLIEDARLAARVGADGVHVPGGAALDEALESLKPERIVGADGLASRDEAMRAGEVGADYLMFGGPEAEPDQPEVVERVAWWAEIFNVPCVGYARALDEVGPIAKAGAEFVALGDAVWDDPRGAPAAIAEAQATLAAVALPVEGLAI